MKKLALGMMLLVGGGLAWRSMHADAPDPKLIFDRFWVDHMPQSAEEQFQPFWIRSEHPFGRFLVRNQWTGTFEDFHYHVLPKEPGALDLLFGRTHEIERVRYTARPCNENGFDYCLDISGTSRGVKRYYSKKDWGPMRSEDEALEQLRK